MPFRSPSAAPAPTRKLCPQYEPWLPKLTVPKDWPAKRWISGVRPSFDASVNRNWLTLAPYSGLAGSSGVSRS